MRLDGRKGIEYSETFLIILRKNLQPSFLFSKVKRTQNKTPLPAFSVSFAEFFTTVLFKEHHWQNFITITASNC